MIYPLLSPAELRDPPNTRPPLDLPHMLAQVRGIQTFVAQENAQRALVRKVIEILRGKETENAGEHRDNGNKEINNVGDGSQTA
jgi:hypothetical protein